MTQRNESLLLLWKEITSLSFDYGTLLKEQSESLSDSLIRGDSPFFLQHNQRLHNYTTTSSTTKPLTLKQVRSVDLAWWRDGLDEIGTEIERIGSLIELTVKPIILKDDKRELPSSLAAVLRARLKMAKKLISNAMEHSLLLSPQIIGRLYCAKCWSTIGSLLLSWNLILQSDSSPSNHVDGLKYYISCSLLKDLPMNPLHQLMLWWEDGLAEMAKWLIEMDADSADNFYHNSYDSSSFKQQNQQLTKKKQHKIPKTYSTMHRMFRLCKRMMKKIYRGGLLLFLTSIRTSDGSVSERAWMKEVLSLEQVTLLANDVLESMSAVRDCYLERESGIVCQSVSSSLCKRTSVLVNFIVGEVGDFDFVDFDNSVGCSNGDGGDGGGDNITSYNKNDKNDKNKENKQVTKDIDWMTFSQGRLERWLIPMFGPMR